MPKRARQPGRRAQADVERTLFERYGDLRLPELADGYCRVASSLAGRMFGRGRTVIAIDPLDTDDAVSGASSHVALLIGRTIWDYTARQFWPDTPWPLVEPLARWAERFTANPPSEFQQFMWFPGRVSTFPTLNPEAVVRWPQPCQEAA